MGMDGPAQLTYLNSQIDPGSIEPEVDFDSSNPNSDPAFQGNGGWFLPGSGNQQPITASGEIGNSFDLQTKSAEQYASGVLSPLGV